MNPILLVYFASEIFLILFVLFFAIAFPFVIIVAVFFVLRRNNINRAVWGKFAQSINFTMPNPKQLKIFGKYNGCDVTLAIGARRRAGGSGNYNRMEYFTYCTTKFPHSLRFLLNINSPRGWFADTFDSSNMQIGQPNFDQSFNTKCYDQRVLQTLLLSDFPSNTTQNLIGDLMQARQNFKIIKMSDIGIYIETSGQVGDENVLRNLIETTAYLRNRFQDAREQFPLADWEKHIVKVWQKFAAENNLAFDSKAFQIKGIYKNFPVSIEISTDSGKWQTIFNLRFPQSLMIGLKIFPENSIHKALTWVGVQDIEVNNKAFNDKFIVKSNNETAARMKLREDFCTLLLQISTYTSNILINDEEIVLTFDAAINDENTLKSYFEGLILIAQKVTHY